MFRPVSERIIKTITRELTEDDIAKDSSWMDAVILTNNNFDRRRFNTLLAEKLAKRSNQIVVRWKNPIVSSSIPSSVATYLADESLHPELLGYFVFGGKSVILSNGSGNVEMVICNGTRCTTHSVA